MKKCVKRVVKTQNYFNVGDSRIEYTLIRSSARKTISVCIDEKAEVKVSVPYYCKKNSINGFLKEKEKWLLKNITTAKKNRRYLDKKSFHDGNEFLYLGRKYRLSVIEGDVVRSRIIFDSNKGWTVTIPSGLSEEQSEVIVKTRMLKWYRLQAEEILGGRIFYYSRIIGEEPVKIAIRTQKRMWGCCDYNKRIIHLNWQIILSPLCVVDYVVVHELCHLIVPNHSQRFWNKVKKFMPDFDIHRKWLKNNYLEMMLPI